MGAVAHVHLSVSCAHHVFPVTTAIPSHAHITHCLFIRHAFEGTHVLWVDNFNRNFAVGNVKLEHGVYHEGNWTASGVHRCEQNIDMNWKDKDGKVRASFGLPDDLFTSASIGKWLIDMMKLVDKKGLIYRKRSLIHKFDVRRVPLKPSSAKVDDPKHKAGLLHNDLSRFYPDRLLPENIGSNVGLLDVLHRFWTEDWKDATDFKMVVADINIFKRIIKVRLSVGFTALSLCVDARVSVICC
jgi:hypothetical protein